MADYKIRKDRETGLWVVTGNLSQPIPHATFRGAVETVGWLYQILGHHKNTERGRPQKYDPFDHSKGW